MNRRHEDFQSSALPTELPRQDVGMGEGTAMSYSNQAAGNVKQLFLTLCLAPSPGHASRGFLESGVSGWRLRRPCPVDSSKNLVLFRETKLFQFREHECSIDTDFKSPTAALDELGCNPVLILNRVLQTCSIWQVESLSTVFYRDIHIRSLLTHRLEKCTPPRGDTPF